MTDRHKRLIKHTFKQEGNLASFESEYPNIIQCKAEITKKFSCLQLEELLYNSTKNVAQEGVLCLINSKGDGVLSQITT